MPTAHQTAARTVAKRPYTRDPGRHTHRSNHVAKHPRPSGKLTDGGFA